MDVTRHDLLITIRRVLRGESVLSGEIAARALQRLVDQQMRPTGALPERLTPREREVLDQIVEGRTNREIAQMLHLGEGTVRNYVSNILSKLNLANRAEAAAYATKHNLKDSL